MKRRTLLGLGLGAAALVTLGGGAALWVHRAPDTRLSDDARTVLAAAARAILGPVLPQTAEALSAALTAHLSALETAVAGFPPATRTELHQAMALLASAPGRRLICGLHTPWSQASDAELLAALDGMRLSGWMVRRQLYQALHALTNAAYYANDQHWGELAYPGPRPL